MDDTTAAAAATPWLLGRHPVLTRGAMAIERYPGGFATAYRVLRTMAEAGSCVRAYAVEGLGGAQFTTVATIDALRAWQPPTEPKVQVLAATDPAQPYGAALPWPSGVPGSTHRPGRKAGSAVVLVDGELVLYIERGGRSLLTFGQPRHRPAAVAGLAEAARAGRLGPLTLQRCDGQEIAAADVAVDLQAAGFALTPRGLRLRAG